MLYKTKKETHKNYKGEYIQVSFAMAEGNTWKQKLIQMKHEYNIYKRIEFFNKKV